MAGFSSWTLYFTFAAIIQTSSANFISHKYPFYYIFCITLHFPRYLVYGYEEEHRWKNAISPNSTFNDVFFWCLAIMVCFFIIIYNFITCLRFTKFLSKIIKLLFIACFAFERFYTPQISPLEQFSSIHTREKIKFN